LFNYYKKLLIIITAFLISNSAYALTGLEINNLIKSHLSKNGYDSSPSLNEKRVFKDCHDIQVNKLFGNFKTVTVSCNQPITWKIAVRTHLIIPKKKTQKIFTEKNNIELFDENVLVLNTNLSKGEVIQEKDLIYKSFNSSIGKGFYTDKDQLIGRKLKQSINKGQIIKSRHLKQNWMIEKGQSVIISSIIGNVGVIMQGIAKEDGHFNEIIKVANNSSGKIIEGKIINEKKILIKN